MLTTMKYNIFIISHLKSNGNRILFIDTDEPLIRVNLIDLISICKNSSRYRQPGVEINKNFAPNPQGSSLWHVGFLRGTFYFNTYYGFAIPPFYSD